MVPFIVPFMGALMIACVIAFVDPCKVPVAAVAVSLYLCRLPISGVGTMEEDRGAEIASRWSRGDG